MAQELIPGLPDEIALECLVRVPYWRFRTVRAVSKNWREEVESDSFHRLRKATGSSRSILVLAQAVPRLVVGALKLPSNPVYQLTLCEPDSGSWSRLPPIPDFPDGMPLFCGIAGVGRKLVVVGGWNPSSWEVSREVYVYDFVEATWRCGARMPGPIRSFFACGSDSVSMVYVAGGHDEGKRALRSAMAYDVARDDWIPLPDMAHERDECKGVFQHGRFHVIGGYCTNTQGRFEKSSEAFHVATWQWGPVEDVLETATCPRTCVAGDGENLYRCKAGQLVVREGTTWRTMAELPAEVRVAPYMMMWQDKLLVIGSERHGGPYVAYTLEWTDGKRYTWMAVDAPLEYVGHVQATCYLEL